MQKTQCPPGRGRSIFLIDDLTLTHNQSTSCSKVHTKQQSSTMTIIDKISEKLGGKHEKGPGEAGYDESQRHKGVGEKMKEAVGLEAPHKEYINEQAREAGQEGKQHDT
jgi:hypothetical protein